MLNASELDSVLRQCQLAVAWCETDRHLTGAGEVADTVACSGDDSDDCRWVVDADITAMSHLSLVDSCLTHSGNIQQWNNCHLWQLQLPSSCHHFIAEWKKTAVGILWNFFTINCILEHMSATHWSSELRVCYGNVAQHNISFR